MRFCRPTTDSASAWGRSAHAWPVWQWTRGDDDVVIEIRRSSDARRTLRASFCAGALRRLLPEALESPGEIMVIP